MIAMAKLPRNRVAREANDETYADVEQLIYRMAWNAAGRYGGEWEDYVSLANEAYVEAYETFDPQREAKFSTWLWWRVIGKVSAELRRTSLQVRTVETGEDIDLDVLPAKHRFDLRAFLAELSDDAGTVVRLLVESPHEVWDILHHKDTASCVRGGLINRLRGCGWSVARVAESFDEIREALR